MDKNRDIKRAAETLKEADALLINAGAGIGVDSGLPDFRGNTGFWKAYPPIAKLGISFSEMANPAWFDRRPHLAWAFYGHRLNLYRKTIPHSGFMQLLELAEKKPGKYFVFTSNVDGQFQKAGYDEECIEECHGSIHHFQCNSGCSSSIWDGGDENVDVDMDRFEALDPLPECIHCGGLARPNILMFGDWGWISDRTDQQGNRLRDWLEDIGTQKMKLAVVELGAGEAVPTVRINSEHIAKSYGGTLIRINPRDYHVPSGHISIPSGSADGVNMICRGF